MNSFQPPDGSFVKSRTFKLVLAILVKLKNPMRYFGKDRVSYHFQNTTWKCVNIIGLQ